MPNPPHLPLIAFPPSPLPAPRWVASSAGGARFNFDDKKSGFLTGVDSGVTAMRGARGWWEKERETHTHRERERGIRHTARGSACGFVVLHVFRVQGLGFRFWYLNPEDLNPELLRRQLELAAHTHARKHVRRQHELAHTHTHTPTGGGN